MGLSDEGEESVLHRFEELCLDLNMDKNAKEEAWQSYQRIQTNYTLEGNQLHWLACALYESCRRSIVPTVGRGQVEGNCVSLTRLLRSAKFSLIQFFNKMKKWADMASLPQEFRDKVDRLERNFAVSTVIFKKFEPIFLDIFLTPGEPNRHQRSRKQRRLPCSTSDVFNFAWTMFVQVKGNFPAISDDLVNSYHLLLCAIDWFYANALLGGRKDLLNPEFSGLPDTYHNRDWKPPTEAPCIISLLCEKHDGLVVEAKTIKEHWWKPHLKRLFERKILRGRAETLSAILEIGNFEVNSKSINNAYEEYVLSVGDFDERIFLGDDAEEEIGTPGKTSTDLAEQMQKKRSLKQHFDQTRSLAPSTPLTGRRYLKEKDPSVTPVSTATQSVSRLQALLSGRKTVPSDALLEMFGECTRNPKDDILKRVKEMGEVFCGHYVQPSENHPGAHIDFAKRRLQLGESLYYKMLENIVNGERKRLANKDPKADLTGLLEHDMFHRSLYACCLEIVIFSYNSQRIFPWIVEVFELSSYHLYKVIEIVIRAEEGLSRDVVKHLNHIEECILDSAAWKRDSPLWDAIQEENGAVPSCEEVTPPSTVDNNGNVTSATNSPMVHPRVRTLAGEGRSSQRMIKIVDPLQSPTGPSASDRFSSPQPGNVKRQLFGPSSLSNSSKSILEKQLNTGVSDTVVSVGTDSSTLSTGQQTIIAVTSDGRQVLIPVQTLVQTTPKPEQPPVPPSPSKATKTRKTGSLALFFRKVYHLVGVRLRDLCDRLELNDEDLRRKMWTCFEYVLVHATDLMKDRHLDQLLMCAIYVMAKVSGKPLTFQNIMKCYRVQPQAQSHVYRSVLLSDRRRHTSGSSESSKSAASGSSSPVNLEREDSKDKKRTDLVYIRSSSTLPVPHPNSQPPTPTKLCGIGTTFDFGEERGDLIQFYNTVFVKRIKDFANKFSTRNAAVDAPPLSPLPPIRAQPASPRRVSSKYSVYISPHQTNLSQPAQPKGISYCINRSPAKELRAINNMVRMGERKLSGKRLLEVDREEDSLESPSKQTCRSHFMRRLQDVNSERQEANGVTN